MRSRALQSSVLGGVLGLTGLVATAAHAQSVPRGTAVEEVVVTGEVRERNLQTAPIAASVLTAEMIEKKSVDDLTDLQFATPSLTVSNAGQANQFNIRGLGKNGREGNSTSSVATYRDGVATVSGFFAGEPYYDVATIEVLRGPQGTFLGQNASAGALLVNTRDPSLEGVGGYVQAGAGNYSLYEFQGALNLPLSDTLALRVAYNHSERNESFSTILGVAGRVDQPELDSGRISLLWRPSEALNVVWKTDLNNLDWGGYAHSPKPGTAFAAQAASTTDIFRIAYNTRGRARDRFVRSVLDVEYRFGNGISLQSLSSYQFIRTFLFDDDDSTAVTKTEQTIGAEFEIVSQELRLVSPDEGPFTWILGAYYQREVLEFPPLDFLLTLTGVGTIDLYYKTPRTTLAAFGQASYDITPNLELQAGLRYSDFESRQFVAIRTRIPATAVGVTVVNPDDHQDSGITGKVALNWTINPEHFVYAFVATGRTTGGINVTLGQGEFDDSEVTDYEVGWKATLMEGRLLTQLGGFYEEVKDYQVTVRNPQVPNRGGIQNLGGTSKIYGVEFTAQADFGALAIDVGAAWIESKLGSVTAVNLTAAQLSGGGVAPQCPAGQPTTLPVCFDYTPFIETLTGRRQPYTPKYTFNVGVEYALELGDGMTLTPRVDYGYVSQQLTSVFDFRNPTSGILTDRLEPRNIWNAQAVLQWDPWRITAYATNFTDEHYISAHGGNNRYAAPPRQYGVRVHRSF